MDGTNVIQLYRHVKIPYIRPVIIANCVLVLNGSLRSFDISFLLTKGGPGTSSMVMAMYGYQVSFNQSNMGYGSCISVGIFVYHFL